jgi:hypothetical protein
VLMDDQPDSEVSFERFRAVFDALPDEHKRYVAEKVLAELLDLMNEDAEGTDVTWTGIG